MTEEKLFLITEEQLKDFEDGDLTLKQLKEIRSNPYNPQAEREKVLAKVIADINRVSLTGFTKYTYRKWILEELRKGGEQG
jgi:hypothetical protein